MNEARMQELPESRLYTFIDEERQHALYFLEGQRLIHDLALMHSVSGAGFAFYRGVLLGVQPMIALLKSGEQLGFYIDSEQPYFRLKIETSFHGATRSMLLPERFSQFPETVTGLVRVLQAKPDGKPPYQSVIRADALPSRELANRVLAESWQIPASVQVANGSDQSFLLHELPRERRALEVGAAVTRHGVELGRTVRDVLERGLTDRALLIDAMAGVGLRYLAERAVRFQCGCSRTRMIEHLRAVAGDDLAELFDPGQIFVEVICEYCKTGYRIGRDEFLGGAPIQH